MNCSPNWINVNKLAIVMMTDDHIIITSAGHLITLLFLVDTSTTRDNMEVSFASD